MKNQEILFLSNKLKRLDEKINKMKKGLIDLEINLENSEKERNKIERIIKLKEFIGKISLETEHKINGGSKGENSYDSTSYLEEEDYVSQYI